MARKYSVKSTSRRSPIHVIYNAFDLALNNSRVLFLETFASLASFAESSYNSWLKNLLEQLQEIIQKNTQQSEETPSKLQKITEKHAQPRSAATE